VFVFISCTDITNFDLENGVELTKSIPCKPPITEYEPPIYVINGEKCPDDMIIQLNIKFIEKIEVLKDRELLFRNGSEGARGIVLIDIKDNGYKLSKIK